MPQPLDLGPVLLVEVAFHVLQEPTRNERERGLSKVSTGERRLIRTILLASGEWQRAGGSSMISVRRNSQGPLPSLREFWLVHVLLPGHDLDLVAVNGHQRGQLVGHGRQLNVGAVQSRRGDCRSLRR